MVDLFQVSEVELALYRRFLQLCHPEIDERVLALFQLLSRMGNHLVIEGARS